MKLDLAVYELIKEISIRIRLPKGKLKQFLAFFRSCLWRYYNPLYALNKMISKAELLEDGILFVELGDGTKFYGQQDETSHLIKYGNPQKLGEIRQFYYFGGFLEALCEQYVEGLYEKHYEFKEGDTVVDMGAHLGTFSIKAAKAVGDGGRVIAIEPQVDNLRFLQRNIEANGLRNVVVVPKGVWSTKGELKLHLSTISMAHSVYADCLHGMDTNEVADIEVDTLDNILRELGVKKVDFIKMDIEGAEVEALKGMEATLRNNDVKLAGEHHTVNGERTYKAVAQQLKQMGFEVDREGHIVYARKRA